MYLVLFILQVFLLLYLFIFLLLLLFSFLFLLFTVYLHFWSFIVSWVESAMMKVMMMMMI